MGIRRSLPGLLVCLGLSTVHAEVGTELRARLDALKASRARRNLAAGQILATSSKGQPLALGIEAEPETATPPDKDEDPQAASPDYQEFTLDQAEAMAFQRSFLLDSFRSQWEAARQTKDMVSAHPELRMQLRFLRDFGNLDSYGQEPYFGLTQVFDLFGNRAAARRVVEQEIDLKSYATEGFRQSLRYQVGTQFRTLQYRIAKLRAANFSVRLGRNFLRIAKKRRDAGAVPELDVIRAQSELIRSQSDRKLAHLEIIKARGALARTLGFEDYKRLRVVETLESSKLQMDEASLRALAMANRVDLKSLGALGRKLEAQKGVIRQKRKPVLSGSFEVEDNPAQSPSRYGGLALDVAPLWYGKIQRELSIQDTLRDAVDSRLKELKRALRIRLKEGLDRVEILGERLLVLQYQEIPNDAKQLEMVERGYRAGGLTNLAVLEAQRRVIDVTDRYLDTLNDYQQELLLLAKETGMSEISVETVATSNYVRKWLFGGPRESR